MRQTYDGLTDIPDRCRMYADLLGAICAFDKYLAVFDPDDVFAIFRLYRDRLIVGKRNGIYNTPVRFHNNRFRCSLFIGEDKTQD